MPAQSAISMRNIHFGFGEKKVLQNFDLEIDHGKTYCLVGSSGSGKTTTLRLMNGLLRPQSGDIYIDGKKFDFSMAERWRRSMGYSIQGSGLFPHLNIEENLSIIARKEKWSSIDIKKRIEELCELISLPSDTQFLKKKPRQISGGQQQRIGIARALFLKPSIMLMDEPFSALDPITRSDLQKEFLKLQSHLQMTIVLVTHDLPEAFSMADQMILLNQGRIEQKGKPSQFLLSPNSDYVQNFIQSHSPGNILKEIYLYSVINSNIYTAEKKSDEIKLKNLETNEIKNFTSEQEAQSFLTQQNQDFFYWVDTLGTFLSFQEFNNPYESSESLQTTDHILSGMKKVIQLKTQLLPVVNDQKKLIGVFSEGSLNAL